MTSPILNGLRVVGTANFESTIVVGTTPQFRAATNNNRSLFQSSANLGFDFTPWFSGTSIVQINTAVTGILPANNPALALNIPAVNYTSDSSAANNAGGTRLVAIRQPTFTSGTSGYNITIADTVYIEGGTKIGANTGTITTVNSLHVDNNSISSTDGTKTISTANSLYIDGPPSAGANVTITTPYALNVNTGDNILRSQNFIQAEYLIGPPGSTSGLIYVDSTDSASSFASVRSGQTITCSGYSATRAKTLPLSTALDTILLGIPFSCDAAWYFAINNISGQTITLTTADSRQTLNGIPHPTNLGITNTSQKLVKVVYDYLADLYRFSVFS